MHVTIKNFAQNFAMEYQNCQNCQHSYFYQCQGIMAITEINKLDFVVYKFKDMHIETTLLEQGK